MANNFPNPYKLTDPLAGQPRKGPIVSVTPISSLWVRLNLSSSAAGGEPGSLRLTDTAGGYDVTLPIAGNFTANSDTVDVQFVNVPTTGSYSLTYFNAADGPSQYQWTIYQNVPYQALQNNAGTPTADGLDATLNDS